MAAINPWLDIDLSDYEAHMSSPGARQSQALRALLKEELDRLRPNS